MSSSPMQRVFVDCENVPTFDLSAVSSGVAVTLVFGKHQKQVGIGVLRASLQLAGQVSLIETGATGHNALDLILAAHLGRAWAGSPDDEFIVVSKDKDFDPLITHLKNLGMKIRRDPDLLAPSKAKAAVRARATPAPAAGAHKRAEPAARTEPAAAPRPRDVLSQFIAALNSGTEDVPKRKASLLRHITNRFGNHFTPEQAEAVFQQLIAQGVVALTPSGALTYPLSVQKAEGLKS